MKFTSFKEHVRRIMQKKTSHEKSAALADLSEEVFGEKKCDEIKTGIGIVTTRWVSRHIVRDLASR